MGERKEGEQQKESKLIQGTRGEPGRHKNPVEEKRTVRQTETVLV